MTPINVYGQRVTKVPKIGVLWPTANETEEEPFIRSLRSGLQELGYVEGSTVILENRFASRQYDRFDALAAELVWLPVDLLIAVWFTAARFRVGSRGRILPWGLRRPCHRFSLVDAAHRQRKLWHSCLQAPSGNGCRLPESTFCSSGSP